MKFKSRKTGAFSILSVMVLFGLTACGGGDAADATDGDEADGDSWQPVDPSEGTDIPDVDVEFAMRPYADNTFYVIGMEEGWYDDVGISITPEPTGLNVEESQYLNLLLNHEVDISTATSSMLVPTYETDDELKNIAHAVTFYGSVMFAHPDLELSTLQDYIDEGEDFDTALASALEPLVDEDVYVNPTSGDIAFNEIPFEVADVGSPNYVTMEDSEMFLLAQSGEIEFLRPAGAPIAYELLELGWTPVYDTRQITENTLVDAESPFAPFISNNGMASSATYMEDPENQETILRMVSVLYRIAAETAEDPSLFELQVPYLNSVSGTSFEGYEELYDSFELFHEITTFEDAERYYVDDQNSEYYAHSGQSQIDELEERGLITPGQVTPDGFIWAAGIYEDLLRFEAETQEMMDGAGDLDAEQQELMDEAQMHYDNYNFLDAWRLATAATEG